MSSLPTFHDKSFKWPNIDIFFLTQRDSYIYALTWGVKNTILMKQQELYPLRHVMWEGLKMPIPACTNRIISTNYGDGLMCTTPVYIHKTNAEYNYYLFETKTVPCSRLHKFYPFVFWQALKSRDQSFVSDGVGMGEMQILKIGDKVIHNITQPQMPKTCS